jgi:transposase InsO family protein
LGDTIAKQGAARDQLTVHADRATPWRPGRWHTLLADLGATKSHSRLHCSNHNPYSEADFKMLRVDDIDRRGHGIQLGRVDPSSVPPVRASTEHIGVERECTHDTGLSRARQVERGIPGERAGQRPLARRAKARVVVEASGAFPDTEGRAKGSNATSLTGTPPTT